MEYTRRFLFFLIGVLYASGWWGASTFPDVGNGVLWMLPAISTIVIVVLLVAFFVNTWDQK